MSSRRILAASLRAARAYEFVSQFFMVQVAARRESCFVRDAMEPG
jgi:hypothetical protein